MLPMHSNKSNKNIVIHITEAGTCCGYWHPPVYTHQTAETQCYNISTALSTIQWIISVAVSDREARILTQQKETKMFLFSSPTDMFCYDRFWLTKRKILPINCVRNNRIRYHQKQILWQNISKFKYLIPNSCLSRWMWPLGKTNTEKVKK